jgi:hypothetical protein
MLSTSVQKATWTAKDQENSKGIIKAKAYNLWQLWPKSQA